MTTFDDPMPQTVSQAWQKYLDELAEDGAALEDTEYRDAFLAGYRAAPEPCETDRLTIKDVPVEEGDFIERRMADLTSDLEEPAKAIASAAYFDAWVDFLEYHRCRTRSVAEQSMRHERTR